MRARIEVLDRDVARQDLAVAVDEIGAIGGDGGRDRAALAAWNTRDIDKAHQHQREGRDAHECAEDDPPLKDGGRLVHVTSGWQRGASALALRNGDWLSGAVLAVARQLLERGELHRGGVVEAELAVRERRDAVRRGEPRPFGLQHADLARSPGDLLLVWLS